MFLLKQESSAALKAIEATSRLVLWRKLLYLLYRKLRPAGERTVVLLGEDGA